jgi:hypothetical protein
MNGELTNNYHDIIEMIEQAKNRVNAYVNRELIDLYLGIGEYVSNKAASDGWGKQTVKTLADFLSKNYPDVKGFSAQNIWRMKQFYETYKDDEKLSPLVRELN